MSLPAAILIHPVTIARTYTDYVVPFTDGSAAFTPGETLTGASSEATGIIKSVSVSAGSWAEGDAAGQVIVYHYSGSYTPAETLSDSGDTPGTAIVASAPCEHVVLGDRQETEVNTTVNARFGEDTGTTEKDETGTTVASTTVLLIAAGTDIAEGDTVVSTNIGYVGTYRVKKVFAIYAATTLSHLMAELQREVAT